VGSSVHVCTLLRTSGVWSGTGSGDTEGGEELSVTAYGVKVGGSFGLVLSSKVPIAEGQVETFVPSESVRGCQSVQHEQQFARVRGGGVSRGARLFAGVSGFPRGFL